MADPNVFHQGSKPWDGTLLRRRSTRCWACGGRDRATAGRTHQTFGARADLLACGSTSVDRFGRIDVLVNNAGASFKGFFEEMSPTQVKQQLATICWGR